MFISSVYVYIYEAFGINVHQFITNKPHSQIPSSKEATP